MAYLSREELDLMGFNSLGTNVQISDKASIYDAEKITIGDHSRIDDFCLISGNVTLGKNVHIAAYCNISGGNPGIVMEDFSGLAYGCHVFAQSDDYSGESLTNPTIPEQYKNVTYSPVKICRHVIIGTKSVILPGVIVSEGCSVGAMSMVTKTTKSWGIYFGAPAKRIKERSKKLLELETIFLEEQK